MFSVVEFPQPMRIAVERANGCDALEQWRGSVVHGKVFSSGNTFFFFRGGSLLKWPFSTQSKSLSDCLSNCSRSVRQSWCANLSELSSFGCQLRDNLIQGMLLSFQRVHHLHKFFN